MFSVLTVNAAISFNIQSISYIDNRDFPGSDLFIPGPIGYENLISDDVVNVVSNVMFFVNPCLADGFLVRFMPNQIHMFFQSDCCRSIVAM